MRWLRLTTNHPAYLEQFYGGRAGLEAEAYDAQFGALMADCYGWADYWSTALAALGYETSEVVANAEPMQKRWAEEHGVEYDEENWFEKIATAQIKSFRPDVLFLSDFVSFSAAYLRALKAECPSIRLVVGWCGAPYKDTSVLREYDVVLSCVPELVSHFRDSGHLCHHVHHAFAPRVLERLDGEATPSEEFIFIGSILKQDKFHHKREALLLELVKKTDIKLWANLHQPAWRQRFSTLARQLAFDGAKLSRQMRVPEKLLSRVPVVSKAGRWEARPQMAQTVDRRIARRARPPLYALDMYRLLRRSKVVLNNHIDISTTSASNMRLFEATGVGVCLLTDWKPNLPEIFEPDAEVATYKSADECAEKAIYLLNHPEERARIAAAGQRRTLAEHTFSHRAARMDEIIKEAVLKTSAPALAHRLEA